jgi:hypothetical protein
MSASGGTPEIRGFGLLAYFPSQASGVNPSQLPALYAGPLSAATQINPIFLACKTLFFRLRWRDVSKSEETREREASQSTDLESESVIFLAMLKIALMKVSTALIWMIFTCLPRGGAACGVRMTASRGAPGGPRVSTWPVACLALSVILTIPLALAFHGCVQVISAQARPNACSLSSSLP